MARLAPVKPYPALPTPSPSFPHQEAPSLLPALASALRRVSRTSPAHGAPKHALYASTSTTTDDAAKERLQELHWSGREVRLLSDGHLVRTYSFTETGEEVAQAMWVELEVAAAEAGAVGMNAAGASTATAGQGEGLFGPYTAPTATAWTDDPLPLPSLPLPPSSCPAPSPSPTSEKTARREKTLLILLQTLLFAFPPSGGRCVVPLPFRVRRAWALEGGGVLVEREGGGWYTLRGTAEEFKPVVVLRPLLVNGGDDQAEEQEADEAPAQAGEPDERIVFCSVPSFSPSSSSPSASPSPPQHPPTPALILTAHPHSQTLTLSSLVPLAPCSSTLPAPAPSPPSSSSAAAAPGKKVERAAPPPPAGADGGGGGGGGADLPLSSPIHLRSSTLGPAPPGGTKRKHLSDSPSSSFLHHGGGGDADRAVRRASGVAVGGPPSPFSLSFSGRSDARGRTSLTGRMSLAASGGIGMGMGMGMGMGVGAAGADTSQAEAELLSALSSAAGQAERSFSLSLSSSRAHPHPPAPPAVDRRTSTSRNDLSVTMNRMALSQGSSLGFGVAEERGVGRERERDREWAEVEREGSVWIPHPPHGVDGLAGEAEDEARDRERDREREKAEVGVREVWKGSGVGDLTGASAHLYDFRLASSPVSSSSAPSASASATATATLAIHLPTTSTLLLLTLHFTSPPSPSSTASSTSSPVCSPELVLSRAEPLAQLPALSCASVLATRASSPTSVRDLLVLKPNGAGVGLLTAQGREVPLALPVGWPHAGEGKVQGVESAGGGGTNVVLSLAGGGRRLVRLQGKEKDDLDLGERALQCLAQVLPLDEFVRVLESVLRSEERERDGGKGGRWDAVERVVDELFGCRSSSPPSGAEAEDPFVAFLAASGSTCAPSDPLLAHFRPSPPAVSLTAPPTSPLIPTPTKEQQSVLLALHLLFLDLTLRAAPRARSDAKRVGRSVARWAGVVGLSGWVDMYGRWMGERFGPPSPPPSPRAGAEPLLIPPTPPDLLAHLSALLSGCTPSPPLLSLPGIASHVSLPPPSNFYGPAAPVPLTAHILSLYNSLTSPSSSSSSTTTRAHSTVAQLYTLLTSGQLPPLSDLAVGVALPLREAVRMSQLDPPEPGSRAAERAGWVRGTYELVGRADLARQLGSSASPPPPASTLAPTLAVQGAAEGQSRSIDALARLSLSGGSGEEPAQRVSVEQRSEGGGGGAEPPAPPATRFNDDKRLEEVQRMLQFWEPVTVGAGERTLDQLTPQIQQSILLALSSRTLSLPLGHGIFLFRTSAPPTSSSTSAIPIHRVNTSARVLPMPSPVQLLEKEPRDPSNPAAPPDRLEWPEFHAGVAAALQLHYSSGAGGVDSSQLSFNRPSELDARHAGLLLGLGLTGQLKSMLSSQAYDYLKAKHDPTSVGLLLGLAVSFLGSADPTVTSVVSIHLPALHPPRSNSLNVSGMTQAAAAVAVGLVHFGTGRRRYADVLLREIEGMRVINVEDAAACREAYALSCGFAFGMIMLGKGREAGAAAAAAAGKKEKEKKPAARDLPFATPGTSAEKEVELLRVFRTLVLGSGSTSSSGSGSAAFSSSTSAFPSSTSSQPGAPIDLNITSPSATVALALMYLRSHRADVASILDVPDSPRGLDYVRHDLLLLRTTARGLIMWDDVRKSKEWVEAQLPAFLRDAADAAQKMGRPMEGDEEVARWSIVAGACFAVGLKFAGTAAAEAHATLIHYLDRLTRASYAKTTSVQGKLKRQALRGCLGAVALSLAMVMAGTGEVNVLRRLRVAHGLFSEGVSYGSHLATHMALGLLFIGQGKFTLGNTDAAVAALLLALYPAFPATPTENRGHLQAYRHLWVLAVEPRYLDARDVDTGEPVFLPVKLRLVDPQDGSGSSAPSSSKVDLRSKQLVAPTLIPDLRQVESISIDSPRYWPFSLRLSSNPSHLARFLSSSTLYVKRRTGHLSYAQDPRGIRSIFTRSKSETGSSVFDLGEMGRMLNPSPSGLRAFVAAFSGSDAEAVAATKALCLAADEGRLPSEFEAFAASALLECLTKDKRDVVGVYHASYEAATALDVNAFTRSCTNGADLLFDAAQLRFVVDFYRNGAFKALFSKPKPGSSKSAPSASGSSQVSRDPLISPAFIDHLHLRLLSLATSLSSSPELASALRAYLASPTASPLSPPLAFLLSSLRLPALPHLQQLQQLVRGAVVEQGMGEEEVAVVLRAVGKKIAEQQGGKSKAGAWERDAERWMAESWVE
ncbi:hypothetical protein JCM10213_003604 [Rhodosporidiobolus nylandii]